MFFTYLIIYAVLFVAAELLRPKPDIENARPSGLSDFNFPTATEGRAVPLLWGTVATASPNVIWYGDLRTERIQEKVKTGLFSSKDVTVGYKYYIGLDFGICRGPFSAGDGLIKIILDDETLWDNGTPLSDGQFSINQPNFFGSDNGGIIGAFTLFPGSDSQARSTYLENKITLSPDILPAYRGTVHLVAHQIYIGNQASLRPIKFVVRRIPNGLGLLAGDATINTNDANPMNVLYEILTNHEWGLSVPTASIDTATLATIGATLSSEGNGFSAMLDAEKRVDEVVKEIERQTNGVMYRNMETGQYTFRLIRDTDIPSPISSIPAVNETNCSEMTFGRASWSETTNIVRVRYADPDKNYATSFGLAQDMANLIIQQGPVATTENFMGVKNKTLANELAWRDLRNLAQPVAKAHMSVNRELYSVVPGDLIRVTWSLFGLSDLLMRVVKVNYGELLSNKIVIDAVEDIFTQQAASFGDPIDTSWTAPTQTVIAEDPEDQVLMEAPRILQLHDPNDPTSVPRTVVFPRLTGNNGDAYSLLTSNFPTKSTAVSTISTENTPEVAGFMRAGVLRSSIVGAEGALYGSFDIDVDPFAGDDLSDLVDAASLTNDQMGKQLLGLAYICSRTLYSPDELRDFGEFVIYKQATLSASGSPTLQGVRLNDSYRGALDTTAKAWPAGSVVFFVSFGGAGLSSETFTANYWSAAKVLPSTQDSGTLAAASATPTNAIKIHSGLRANAPLPPVEIKLGSTRYAATVNWSIFTASLSLNWLRRNWRTTDARLSAIGYDDDGTVFAPGGADAGDNLSYVVRVYDIGSPNIGSPNLIYEKETTVDDSGNDTVALWYNDILGMVLNPNDANLRLEVTAKHQPGASVIEAREKLIHDFVFHSSAEDYSTAKFLGRIPYGTVVSPGIEIFNDTGSPGSPQNIPVITMRFARGVRVSEGPGTGENGKVYILADGGSPGVLVHNAQLYSPDTQYYFPTIVNGSPSNWAGYRITVLHYHYEGRPIFFEIKESGTGRLYAWGVMVPSISTVPAPGPER